MRESFKRGISFGLTSGIITTLGLIVGLNSGTGLKIAVIGGIITIAIADAFSDSLGIHISEESSNRSGKRAIWESTFSTFLTKLFVSLSFIIPFLIFKDLGPAVITCIFWGFILLTIFNYFLALEKKEEPWKIIGEHLLIALAVVIISSLVGEIIAFFSSKAL